MKVIHSAFFILLSLFIISNTLKAQEKKKVRFSAASMQVDKKLGNGAKRLLGNVVFDHEGTIMKCDSAYFFSDLNTLEAYHNIYINQADTLHLYGEYLEYDGNTKLAKVRKNVKLVNRETVLTTEALDYDLENSVGYYTVPATILNDDNTISSNQGYYYVKSDMLFFKDSVKVVNPRYEILSDTLKYQTKLKIAYFHGPTDIYSDENHIYCENGWYNTETNIAQLNEHAFLENDKQKIAGDSLYYERETGYGRGVDHVRLFDYETDIILKGNFGIYNEQSEEAMLTDSAEMIQITDTDSIYMHSDTIRSVLDTAGYKIVKSYYGVKMFKSDLQAKADSVTYSFQDSVIRLYDKPVIWSEENQLTADYIEIHTRNKKMYKMLMENSSFIVSREDSSFFNQIKGKNMVCYFRDNKLYRIDVNGNGQTIYYPEDEDELIGMNKAACSDLIIYLDESKVDRINFLTKPDATLYPLKEIPENLKTLSGFIWLDAERPYKKEDIFK
jgi:lipopolysaccharide export system protein LptA